MYNINVNMYIYSVFSYMQTQRRDIHVACLPDIPPLPEPLDNWFENTTVQSGFTDIFTVLLDAHKVYIYSNIRYGHYIPAL